MAIVFNKSTEIGDVIVIKTGVPIVGIVTLTGFIDNTEGEDSNKFFEKTFRYSNDGVSYSDWVELTQENIEDIQFDISDTFTIEYNYKRVGISNIDELTFNSITLEGQFAEPICGSAFKNSIFGRFLGDCNNLCSLNWSINVLEKIYAKGLIPDYIERGNNSSNVEDKDFVDFWRSITHYFAWFVCLARKFANFHTNEDFLREYLVQRGLSVCIDTEYLDLVYLRANFLDEIRQRGTIQIAKIKQSIELLDESVSLSDSDSEIPFEYTKIVDGELIRLICKKQHDEFLFNLCSDENIGWNIGNSSPLYRSQHQHLNLNKAYEDYTFDLSKYPLINGTLVELVEESGLKSIKLVQDTGIGGILNTDKFIFVNKSVDYEITFEAKGQGSFDFGVFAFDSGNNLVEIKSYLGLDNNYFFENQSLVQDDKYYPVRGYIYSHSASNDLQQQLSLGFGNHLQFKDNNVVKIIPYIFCNSDDILVRGLKINPINTPFSNGFIQTPNMIHIWGSNRNLDLSQKKLNQFIGKYLIPYNSTFEFIDLQQQDNLVEEIDQSNS